MYIKIIHCCYLLKDNGDIRCGRIRGGRILRFLYFMIIYLKIEEPVERGQWSIGGELYTIAWGMQAELFVSGRKVLSFLFIPYNSTLFSNSLCDAI